ncbi:DUF1214 domain-containing protein [Bradyrhizobium sp. 195]|uniref:DUF1214 domain-containing protein n=1 Tax=Bradyrhizobium sp. 195 TaxID=2782662 RepID=UPI002001AA7D|nr:DUF1214 domain-containing protein [Bradyrhizobium sp. 195]UPK29088.1 DUF1214 domain-containing protein [Bradyrhizobium sp. 195]
MGMRDKSGALLSGKRSYVVRVPADVPVDKFWSVIVYNQNTKSFIPNDLDQVGLDSYDKSKLKANADSSVNIYLGNSAPKGEEKNWLSLRRRRLLRHHALLWLGEVSIRQDVVNVGYRARCLAIERHS